MKTTTQSASNKTSPCSSHPSQKQQKTFKKMSSRSSRNKAATSASGNPPKEDRRGIQFPWKLHELLEQAERDEKSHIVSWLEDGKSFKVHKKEEFCNDIMPVWFNSSKYKTWQRSLNLWGFESVVRGTTKGACHHPAFLRGYPDFCKNMTRTKVKGSFQEATHLPNRKTAKQPNDPCGVSNGLAAAVTSIKPNNDVGIGGAFTSNITGISDFLRAKAHTSSADALLEVELQRRLSSARLLNPLALMDLPHGNPSSSQPQTLLARPGYWQGSHFVAGQFGGSGLLRNSTMTPQNAADSLQSAFNIASAALHIIRYEEAGILRRRHS